VGRRDSELEGDLATSINQCYNCYEGTYCPGGTEAMTCIPGHYCPGGTSGPIPCSDPSLCPTHLTQVDNNNYDYKDCPYGNFYLRLSNSDNTTYKTRLMQAHMICPEPVYSMKFIILNSQIAQGKYTSKIGEDWRGQYHSFFAFLPEHRGQKYYDEPDGRCYIANVCYPHWEDCAG